MKKEEHFLEVNQYLTEKWFRYFESIKAETLKPSLPQVQNNITMMKTALRFIVIDDDLGFRSLSGSTTSGWVM